jgi:hypothetical protein
MGNGFILYEIRSSSALHKCRFWLILLLSLETACMVSSVYESLLGKRSGTYARERCLSSNYFYEALVFNVSIAGNYSFWIHSDFNTYGYLYHDVFDAFQPTVNQLSRNDYDCSYWQPHVDHHLLSNTKYILVVTTHWVGVTGSFSVTYDGPTSIQLVRLSKCVYSAIPNEISCLINSIETQELIL